MSSDSDSDICDFTSDISKQMSKGLDQFWQDFNKKIENETTDKANSNIIESKKTEIFCNIENKSSTSVEAPISVKKQNNAIESVDVDITNRITSKLDQLSEQIQTILSNKRTKPRKRGKRKQTRQWQLRRGRKKPNITSSTSVVLSSDEEYMPEVTNIMAEEINPTVTVNILWKSVEKYSFKVHKYQMLNYISEYYSDKFNINPRLLFFTLDDKHIKLEENSFVSLKLSDTKLIEGGVLPEAYLDNFTQNNSFQLVESLNFKVQHNERRNNEINVSCQKDDKMEIIFWKVSIAVQQPVENIKLYFDGCAIKPSSKVSDMGLEEGDCFDLEIINFSQTS